MGEREVGRPWRGRLVICGWGLLLAFGLFTSLRYSLGLWAADPDVAVPHALWTGVQTYGLRFLVTWGHSPDNWIFTLLPLDWALYALAPHSPRLAVLSGWLIFVGCIVLTATLAGWLTRPRYGLALAAILSCAGWWALGAAGFLSYPVTHNISMLWGLGALCLGALALGPGGVWRRVGLSLACGIALTLNVLSDPWATGGIAAPMAIAGLAAGAPAWRRAEGRTALALAALALLAIEAGRTHLFGRLAFLPPSPLQFTNADGVGSNAGWAFRAVAAMFNIAPGANIESPLVLVASGLAALAVLVLAAAGGVRRWGGLDAPGRLVVGVAVTSIALVLPAFLVGQWLPSGLYVGRFFPNLYFFGGLLLVAAIADTAAPPARYWRWALYAFAAAFVVSGVTSRPSYWLFRAPTRNEDSIRKLGETLAANGLSYGYGLYWGSSALSMDWVMRGRVVIRPVTFSTGKVSRLASPLWYQKADEPSPGPRFLVILKDWAECPDLSKCVAIAEAQFGSPVRRIPYESGWILVWPGSIADRIVK